MRKNHQLLIHDPENGVYGDCFRTAVSCLIDKDASEVPHVFGETQDPDEADALMIEYLASLGFHKIQSCYQGSADLDDVLCWVKDITNNLPAILTGQLEKDGCGHCVVIHNGRIIHDPLLGSTGIKHPCKDTGLWHVEFIVRGLTNYDTTPANQ